MRLSMKDRSHPGSLDRVVYIYLYIYRRKHGDVGEKRAQYKEKQPCIELETIKCRPVI